MPEAKELREVAKASRKEDSACAELGEAIRKAADAGFSLRAIAAQAGVSYETVRRMLSASLST